MNNGEDSASRLIAALKTAAATSPVRSFEAAYRSGVGGEGL